MTPQFPFTAFVFSCCVHRLIPLIPLDPRASSRATGKEEGGAFKGRRKLPGRMGVFDKLVEKAIGSLLKSFVSDASQRLSWSNGLLTCPLLILQVCGRRSSAFSCSSWCGCGFRNCAPSRFHPTLSEIRVPPPRLPPFRRRQPAVLQGMLSGMPLEAVSGTIGDLVVDIPPISQLSKRPVKVSPRLRNTPAWLPCAAGLLIAWCDDSNRSWRHLLLFAFAWSRGSVRPTC